MTIDFSARLESGVNEVFPDVIVQKCVFHAIQLLTRGLIKEFTRVKKKYLLEHVEEWKALRTLTLLLEKISTFVRYHHLSLMMWYLRGRCTIR